MRHAIAAIKDGLCQADHPGLLLQRYLCRKSVPQGRDAGQSDHEEKRGLLRASRRATRSDSLGALYALAFERWTSMAAWGVPFRVERLATTGRLAVGLGAENVLEMGLRLHHTYGVPIIPGSALKGLAAHFCHDVWGQRHDPGASKENQLFRRGEAYHSLLFGTTEDAGVITFHDAWVTPESLRDGPLHLDIITPHHPRWQTNAAPPSDFDSPKPLPFLSAAGTFEVRLSWSGPAATPLDQAEAWTALTMRLLLDALAEWGVGGKTSSGYGRLVPPESPRNQHSTSPETRHRKVPPPPSGERVEAQLLEERTKKGGWKAIHTPSGLRGHIVNSADVPSGKEVGDRLELIVHSSNDSEIAFDYPTPSQEQRAQRAPSKGKTGNRSSGKRGRRR